MRGSCCCLVSAALLWACGCTAKTDPAPVLVGHVGPLSGGDKARGEYARQGIRLAVEEASPVAGRRVTVDHADTRSDPEAVRAVIKRLLTINKVVAVLGGPESSQVENLGSVAQANGTPVVLAGGQPARPVADFVFYTGMTFGQQGQALARFAGQELHVKNVAVLTDGSRAALVEAFTRALPNAGNAGQWTYKGADKIKPAADEIVAKKPDALLFAGSADDFAELSRAGLSALIPVLFAGEDGSLGKLQTVRYPSPVYLATVFAADEQLPAATSFIDTYQQRFQDAPDVVAALAYDDARLLFEAMRQAKSVDGAKVRDALAAIRFDGLTGPVTFDKEHTAVRSLFVVRLKEGKAETVKRYDPS